LGVLETGSTGSQGPLACVPTVDWVLQVLGGLLVRHAFPCRCILRSTGPLHARPSREEHLMGGLPGRLTVCLVTVAVTGTLTACSSSKSPSNTPSGSLAISSAVPSVDAGAFTSEFSVMK